MTKFEKFLLGLTMKQYLEFHHRVMNEVKGMNQCPITAQTFRNWRDGKCEPAPEKREQLDKIAFDVVGKSIW